MLGLQLPQPLAVGLAQLAIAAIAVVVIVVVAFRLAAVDPTGLARTVRRRFDARN